MPTLPRAACTVSTCPNRKPCAAHTTYRGSSAQQGYGYAWRVRRAEHLRLHPMCVVCGERATDVDHVHRKELSDELQSMCHAHHSSKTARMDGGFGRPPGVHRGGVAK